MNAIKLPNAWIYIVEVTHDIAADSVSVRYTKQADSAACWTVAEAMRISAFLNGYGIDCHPYTLGT